MRVAVTGGRAHTDRNFIFRMLDQINKQNKIDFLVAGDAAGADLSARMWAVEHHIPHYIFRAEWKKFGKRAGPIRNRQMLVQGKPDVLVAFKGAEGTSDCIATAITLGIEVLRYTESS